MLIEINALRSNNVPLILYDEHVSKRLGMWNNGMGDMPHFCALAVQFFLKTPGPLLVSSVDGSG